MTEVKAFEIPDENSSSKIPDGTTSIFLVLDETGSMSSNKDVTISSFNEYMLSQQNGIENCRASLVTFSSNYGYVPVSRYGNEGLQPTVRQIYVEEDVKNVPLLDNKSYSPAGGTNLYDAIGYTISMIDKIVDNRPTLSNILVVIFTDGEENSSREYSLSQIRSLIQDREKQGWTFVYMGANQDAWKVGEAFGLSSGQTMTYSVDKLGETVNCLAEATASYRSVRTEKFSKAAKSGDYSSLTSVSGVERKFF